MVESVRVAGHWGSNGSNWPVGLVAHLFKYQAECFGPTESAFDFKSSWRQGEVACGEPILYLS